jgi:hypothetical protein
MELIIYDPYQKIKSLFLDFNFCIHLQHLLPPLFQEADTMHRQGGALNQAVGKSREEIIVAVFQNYVGEEIDDSVDATTKGCDGYFFGKKVEIKTITCKAITRWIGPKLHWASGVENGKSFRENYWPEADLLLVRIVWNSEGAIYYIPTEVQQEVLTELGADVYFNKEKIDSDNKGTPISAKAGWKLLGDQRTLKIPIRWPELIKQENDKQYWINKIKELKNGRFRRLFIMG